MDTTKIIAMYLPQYHRIPENDQFWGDGFTDWVTVKKAKPLFEGHMQPRVPLNANYYDLSLLEDVKWQADLAQKYGIDGFGVYHYWFNNDTNILTKPAELIRDSDEIKIGYFFAWDNANWKRSWSNVVGNAWAPVAEVGSRKNNGPEILIPYILGSESDWDKHFDYLKTHFNSSKYIKVDNKPVFIILQYSKEIGEMCEYWNKLALSNGFSGIHFIFRENKSWKIPNSYYRFYYEPIHSGWTDLPIWKKVLRKLCKKLHLDRRLFFYDYSEVWERIISRAEKGKDIHAYYGGFVSYDDTPRRGCLGKVVKNSSPEKFQHYFKSLLTCSILQKKEFLFITAWNEWGEGAYIEPDTITQYDYLQAIKSVKELM